MQKLLDFDTDSSHQSVPACIVWCIDPRFTALLDAFVAHNAWQNVPDIIKVAGGAKALTSSERERNFLLGQIEISAVKHHVPLLILAVHDDCAAYGGIRDHVFYRQELEKAAATAKKFLDSKGLKVEVKSVFAAFDGVFAL